MRDIVHVWRTCFGADDPSVYPFLARYHFGHCAMTEKVEGHIVAMAFTIPCQTAFGLGAYLYGVATLPEFRHQGISTRLVRNLLEHCRESGATFSFLIPSDEEVVAFYDQFGYKTTNIQPVFHSDMDLGTGGGLPGIPLAIYYPEVTFHLVDRIGKKLKVAQDIASRIGLTNVTVQHGDVKEVKGKFDFVVSRAVMDLGDLVPLVKRFIASEGRNAVPNGLICLKGGDLSGEVAKFKHQVLIDELSSYFNEEFFKTKKVLYLPL